MIIRSLKRITRIIRYPRFNNKAMGMLILHIDIYTLFRNKSIINPLKPKISILTNSFTFKLLTI